MEDIDTPSPVVQRLRLRQELRRARLDSGLTQEEVAGVMDWSLSKLVRIENGSNSISTNDLKALLRYYQVSDETQVADLLALSRAARKRSEAGGQGAAARPLTLFMEYEKAAFSTRSFEPLVIPGMLQTPDYMRASTRELAPDLPEAEVTAHVGIRVGRQKLLEAAHPPLMYFVLDEPVVRRVVGGRDVMRDQLRRLIALADMPNMTIEVVPYSAGLRPGMQEPFVMHQLSDSPDDYVLYIENPRGDQLQVEDRDARYRRSFERLRESSLGANASTVFLRQLVDGGGKA